MCAVVSARSGFGQRARAIAGNVSLRILCLPFVVTENYGAGTVARDVKMSRCRSGDVSDYVRGPDAILICEESFLSAEAEAGASRP